MAPTVVVAVVSVRGVVTRGRDRPTAVVVAYVAPDPAASSSPRVGCGPGSCAPAARLTSTRPTSARTSTPTSWTAGAERRRTDSTIVSSTGARPRLTTVETETPTETMAPKYSAW